MTTDQIVLLVVCGVLAISATFTGILVYRQSGHKPHLFTGIGWGLIAIALYLSGLATLLWQAVQGIIAWAAGLATNLMGGIGLAVLALGALAVIFSRVSTRRTKAKVAARRPPTPPPAPAASTSQASSASDSSGERPSLARRLGRLTRQVREGVSSSEGSAGAGAPRTRSAETPRSASPAPLPPSKPSRPLLDMGDSWNSLDLDTPAAAPAPTAAGAPLPVSPTSGAAPTQESRSVSADDEVQQIQSALRPPQD